MSKKSISKPDSSTGSRPLTPKQCILWILSTYLEKTRKDRYYAIISEHKEYGVHNFSYHKLSDDEINIIDYLNNSGDDIYLEEKLSLINGQEKLLERLKGEAFPRGDADEYVIKSCDTNDFYLKSKVKIYFVIGRSTEDYELILDKSTFCELLKMHILKKNKISINNIVCAKHSIASEIFRQVSDAYLVDDDLDTDLNPYYFPYAITLSEIANITNKIMNPQQDCIGLFKNNYNTMGKFLEKYAIKPDLTILYKDETINELYVIADCSCFNLEMSLTLYNEDNYENLFINKDRVVVNISDACKNLKLKDSIQLMRYCLEHYNTIDAVQNFRRDLLSICPDAIVEGK